MLPCWLHFLPRLWFFSPNLHQATVFARHRRKGCLSEKSPTSTWCHIKWRWVVQGPCYWLLLTAVKWAKRQSSKLHHQPYLQCCCTFLIHITVRVPTGLYTQESNQEFWNICNFLTILYISIQLDLIPNLIKLQNGIFDIVYFFFLAFITGKLLQMMQIFHWILTLDHPHSSSSASQLSELYGFWEISVLYFE